MDPSCNSEALATIAEVGVAIAGFSAVALALTSRIRELTLPMFLLRTMIIDGLYPALLALVPAGLFAVGLSAALVWRVSSGVAVVGALAGWPLYFREQRGARDEIPVASRMSLVLWFLGGTAGLLQLLNALGFFFAPGFSAFYFGLWLLLLIAAAKFVYLILNLPR